MSAYTLYPSQQADVDKLMAHDGTGLIVARTGYGKSITACQVGIELWARTVLIVAPQQTHKYTWMAMIERQTAGQGQTFRIDSTAAGKEAYARLKARKSGWYVITPQYFQRLDWSKINPDLAIIDEIHMFGNRMSKSFKALKTLKADARIGMSGTPARNKVENMWSILRWLYPETTPLSYWAWVGDNLKTEYDHFASQNKKVVGELYPGKIVETIPCYIFHDKREKCCEFHPNGFMGDIPEPEWIIREVEMSSAHKKMYREMEERLVTFLENDEALVASLPIVQRTFLRTMALGVPNIDTDLDKLYFESDCESPKHDQLVRELEELDGGKVVVFTHSQKFAHAEVERLNNLGYKTFEWSGANSQKKRDEAMDDFVDGDLQILFAVISAFGVGTDRAQLATNTAIWLSREEDNTNVEQGEGRLDRTGQTVGVVNIEIVTKGTFDEGIISKQIQQRLKMNQVLRGGVERG